MYEELQKAIQSFQQPASPAGRDEVDEKGNPLPDICVPPDRPLVIESGEFLKELLLLRGD